MATRKCSYCGMTYTDESGHDYDECVQTCQRMLKNAEAVLKEAQWALTEAKKVQIQPWWRKKFPKENVLPVVCTICNHEWDIELKLPAEMLKVVDYLKEAKCLVCGASDKDIALRR